MQLTDTHCHLDFNAFDKDRNVVLARAWEAGLERILVPGVDLASSRAAVRLAQAHHRLYAAVGVHPNSSLTWDERALGELEDLAADPKVVAIGEIGLDYYRDRAPHPLQRQVFREQLNLAGRLSLPVVVHTRNSSPQNRSCILDVINILAEWCAKLRADPRSKSLAEHPGVVHSYSGNEAEAQHLLELGFFIGITGPVTFRNAVELRKLVASIPLERLLIETDGPYLTPHPYRGKRNEPAYVRFVAEKISEIHNQSLNVVAEKTTANAGHLFQWREVD